MQIFKDAIFEDTVSSTRNKNGGIWRYGIFNSRMQIFKNAIFEDGAKHQKHDAKRTKEQVEDTEDTGEDLKIPCWPPEPRAVPER